MDEEHNYIARRECAIVSGRGWVSTMRSTILAISVSARAKAERVRRRRVDIVDDEQPTKAAFAIVYQQYHQHSAERQ
jgi:hypothetical protein